MFNSNREFPDAFNKEKQNMKRENFDVSDVKKYVSDVKDVRKVFCQLLILCKICSLLKLEKDLSIIEQKGSNLERIEYSRQLLSNKL